MLIAPSPASFHPSPKEKPAESRQRAVSSAPESAQAPQGFPGPWVTFLYSPEGPCQLSKLGCSQAGSETRGTGFSVPCWVGMGSSPGRRPGRRIRALDSLFAFRQEVRSQQGEPVIQHHSLPWSCRGQVAIDMAPPGDHSWELTPTTERKAWLRGSWGFLAGDLLHLQTKPAQLGPGHTLQDCPASQHMSPEHPCVGHFQGKCPSISQSMTPEGINLVIHTSTPKASAGPGTRCPKCPTMSFSWGEGGDRGAFYPVPHPSFPPPAQSNLSPSLLAHHLDGSALFRSSQASCMCLPPALPHTGLAQPAGSLL